MRARRKRVRLALMVAVAIAAAGAGVAAYQTDVFRWLELHTVDARFALRGERPPPRGVAVVAIDTTTFNEFPKRHWPYKRSLHAKAIRILKAAGAKVIAYDLQFTEPTTEKEDFALFDAVQKAGNVVLGTSEVAPGGHTRILGGDANVKAARALPASAQYDLDPNGVIRRIPFETDGLKTMPVVAYERAFGRLPDRKLFEPDGAWIDFAGGRGSVTTVSFSRLLNHQFPPNIFRGRIVVVGGSAPSLQDVHPTSTTGNDEMSGPEIQAQAIDTLIRDIPLRPVARWVDIALILLLAFIAPLPGLRLGVLAAIGVALVGNALFLGGVQLAFNSGRIVSVTYPLATAVVSTLGVFGVHYFTEVRERRRTRTAFARFVPAAVVDRVLEHAEDGLRLGGEEVLGTVLFSDIRGFTTFSESHDAPEVIEILNKYLGEMTDAIMGHGGTLIGYLGDGIIAIFGAPLEQQDHADRALAAAREMLGPRLQSFNVWLGERGVEEPFQMGVGINSGLFMAGNVGSLERLEYTVIGDTINTASRMEGLTKGSGHSLFVSEATRFMLLRDPGALEYVGEFEIRGRAGKMKVWAPATGNGLPDQPTAERIEVPDGQGEKIMDAKHLDGIELFAALSEHEREELAKQVDEIDVDAGSRLVSEGKWGYEFFVIENGTAEVKRGDEHIADLGPGDFFGEMALLGDTERNADVIASSPLTAVVMTDRAFRHIARTMPAVAEHIREQCRLRTRNMSAG
jgi:adenylate cyclase